MYAQLNEGTGYEIAAFGLTAARMYLNHGLRDNVVEFVEYSLEGYGGWGIAGPMELKVQEVDEYSR